MNQDFTVQKKAIFVWKKNSCRGVHQKKKFLHKQWAKKKKFGQAENSPPPPPPITFLMVRPLQDKTSWQDVESSRSLTGNDRNVTSSLCLIFALLDKSRSRSPCYYSSVAEDSKSPRIRPATRLSAVDKTCNEVTLFKNWGRFFEIFNVKTFLFLCFDKEVRHR